MSRLYLPSHLNHASLWHASPVLAGEIREDNRNRTKRLLMESVKVTVILNDKAKRQFLISLNGSISHRSIL